MVAKVEGIHFVTDFLSELSHIRCTICATLYFDIFIRAQVI